MCRRLTRACASLFHSCSCVQCFQPFKDEEFYEVSTSTVSWISNLFFWQHEGRKYCAHDFHALFAPCCSGCGQFNTRFARRFFRCNFTCIYNRSLLLLCSYQLTSLLQGSLGLGGWFGQWANAGIPTVSSVSVVTRSWRTLASWRAREGPWCVCVCVRHTHVQYVYIIWMNLCFWNTLWCSVLCCVCACVFMCVCVCVCVPSATFPCAHIWYCSCTASSLMLMCVYGWCNVRIISVFHCRPFCKPCNAEIKGVCVLFHAHYMLLQASLCYIVGGSKKFCQKCR